MSKMTKFLIGTALMSFMCVSCNKTSSPASKNKTSSEDTVVVDPLVGKWERYGDEKAGLCVTVSPYGNVMTSKIDVNVSVLADVGFNVGDMKWKNITKVAEGKYSLTDMYKGDEGPKNVQAEIVLDSNGLLTLTNADDATVIQHWKKVDYQTINYSGTASVEGYYGKSSIVYNKDNGFGMITIDFEFMDKLHENIYHVFNDGKTFSYVTGEGSVVKFDIAGDSIHTKQEDVMADYGLVK
jgi:hypothetical protein